MRHVFLVPGGALPPEGGVRADAFPGLSERERQVLSGLLQGRRELLLVALRPRPWGTLSPGGRRE